MLNVDYKIATKAIANRLEKVLPKLIKPGQTGYVKGRYIGENIRLTYDIMDYTLKKGISGIALFLDIRKAFDSISWSYLTKTLKEYGFGEQLLTWVRLFL